jgi:hypothetical protein
LGERLVRAVLIAATLLVAWPQSQAAGGRPSGMPDLADPAVQDAFAPVALSRLNEDPDFPVLLMERVLGGSPQFLLVVYDARNGKETWSFREDTAVFYALFSEGRAIQQAFLDEGFAGNGRPSGKFLAAGPEDAARLTARLQESHRRCRERAQAGADI